MIESIPSTKPFSIAVRWKKSETDEERSLSCFQLFVDGRLVEQIEMNDRLNYQYDVLRLTEEKLYSISMKAVSNSKQIDRSTYQCQIESRESNSLQKKAFLPPKGTPARIERMHPDGIDIVWDSIPTTTDEQQLTVSDKNTHSKGETVLFQGYQVLRNGRAVGKVIPVDQRRAAIRGLQLGNHYSLQVVPLTRLSTIEEGEEYDPERHGHFLPGPRLEVDFRDLVDVPSKIWTESITGRSAMICWSPRKSLSPRQTSELFSSSVQSSSNVKSRPEGLRLFLWNSDEQTREQAKIISLSSKSTSITSSLIIGVNPFSTR